MQIIKSSIIAPFERYFSSSVRTEADVETRCDRLFEKFVKMTVSWGTASTAFVFVGVIISDCNKYGSFVCTTGEVISIAGVPGMINIFITSGIMMAVYWSKQN